MRHVKLVVVGYGHMAKSILSGMIRDGAMFSGTHQSRLKVDEIHIVGRNPRKAESFISDLLSGEEHLRARSSFVQYKTTNEVDIDGSALLLACKPHNLEHFTFRGEAYIAVSVLAGVSDVKIAQYLRTRFVAIVMPNIGAIYGLSSSAVMFKRSTDEESLESEMIARSQVSGLIESFGNCVFVDSFNQISASIATNGSSIAVLAMVAQGLINAGVHEGLTPRMSSELVGKTFEGLAALLKDKSPQEIKEMVTSPGGTTARALLYCDKVGIQGHLSEAMIKAVRKSQEQG